MQLSDMNAQRIAKQKVILGYLGIFCIIGVIVIAVCVKLFVDPIVEGGFIGVIVIGGLSLIFLIGSLRALISGNIVLKNLKEKYRGRN